jgi:LAO/AO transport system kinase
LREHSREAQELLNLVEFENGANNKCLRIGISGSPGVGKSSLIEKLGMFCIQKEGLKVATLVNKTIKIIIIYVLGH